MAADSVDKTKLITAPAVEPVSVSEAKSHLRVDTSTDDTLIGTYITAAREVVEEMIWQRLVTQTWDVFWDTWPQRLRLPHGPLQSVTGVYYTPEGGAEQTYSAANYLVDIYNIPGEVVILRTAQLPTASLQERNGVRVRFVCGYGLAAAVPQRYKQAILLLVGHYYENRESVIVGQASVSQLPQGVAALLRGERAWSAL
jgi:uncharacterized phiE125 gp8 family phage protein